MRLSIAVSQSQQAEMADELRMLSGKDVVMSYGVSCAKLFLVIEKAELVPIAQLIRDRFSNVKNIMDLF